MNADPLILQMKYSDVVKDFAGQMHLSLDAALNFFYHSEVYHLMKDGVSDMHCMSVAYLVEDLKMEYHKKLPAIRKMEDRLKNQPDS